MRYRPRSGERLMKKNNFMKNRIIQFGYDHRGFSDKMEQVRKSADEVNKMLENLSKKPKKEDEETNNQKK